MWFNFGSYSSSDAALVPDGVAGDNGAGLSVPGTVWIRPHEDSVSRFNSAATPFLSCMHIYLAERKSARSGVYWLNLGGRDCLDAEGNMIEGCTPGEPVMTYCDMGDFVNDIGGWPLVYKTGVDI